MAWSSGITSMSISKDTMAELKEKIVTNGWDEELRSWDQFFREIIFPLLEK